jgi:hypothetical protein
VHVVCSAVEMKVVSFGFYLEDERVMMVGNLLRRNWCLQ